MVANDPEHMAMQGLDQPTSRRVVSILRSFNDRIPIGDLFWIFG
jgi:hypothetical protein